MKPSYASSGIWKEFTAIAVPVALQSALQSSFSIIDQIMVGQLGETTIAAVGLTGRFIGFYSQIMSAIAAALGIVLAQYIGQGNEKRASRALYSNFAFGIGLGLLFCLVSFHFSDNIAGLYTNDSATIEAVHRYLRIMAIGFLPRVFSLLFSTLLRCRKHAAVPMAASIFGAVVNTALNYLLIFGNLGAPKLGLQGAAIATVCSYFVEAFIINIYTWTHRTKVHDKPDTIRVEQTARIRYAKILVPILAADGLWSLGENVYGMIYGRLGTTSAAAMTLIGPVMTILMGLLSGTAVAAGIIIGKELGEGSYDTAYSSGKGILHYGALASAVLGLLAILAGKTFVSLYPVNLETAQTAFFLIIIFAVYTPVKACNNIISNIIRSGGKTGIMMLVSVVGTWGVGIPLGLLTAFVLKFPIVWVYILLSLEEVVRLGLSIWYFRTKRWLITL